MLPQIKAAMLGFDETNVSTTVAKCWMDSRNLCKRDATPRVRRSAFLWSSSAVKETTAAASGMTLMAFNWSFCSSDRVCWNSWSAFSSSSPILEEYQRCCESTAAWSYSYGFEAIICRIYSTKWRMHLLVFSKCSQHCVIIFSVWHVVSLGWNPAKDRPTSHASPMSK